MPVDAVLEEPVRPGRLRLDATLPLTLAAFGFLDLLPDPVKGQHEPGLRGVEAGQIRRHVGHRFALETASTPHLREASMDIGNPRRRNA
ncbi:hypothetical protein ACPF8X_00755 [Streptomyces sp. G35A]